MIVLDVNTREVREFTNTLTRMRRSEFPLAVRGTLNDLAFHHKRVELMKSAGELFTLRNPSFIRSHSGVKKAEGWDVNSMRSESGIIPRGLKAAEQLEIQETGGSISNRNVIYVDPARGGSNKNRVSTRNYINKTGIVKGQPTRRRSRKSNIVAMAYVANKTNQLLKIETKSTDHFFRVNSLKFSGSGLSRRANLKMTAIASYDKGRRVTISPRPFMRISGERTMTHVLAFYIKNAKRRFEKAQKI